MSTDSIGPNSTDPNFDYHTEDGKEFEQGLIDKKYNDTKYQKAASIDGNTLSIIFKADDTFHA